MSLLCKNESNRKITTTPDDSSNDSDIISKQLLINYIIRKLEDNPISNYNQNTYEYSKGFRKSLEELLVILQIL